MTGVACDQTAHLSKVARLLMKRGGRMERGHKSFYAAALRTFVRSGKAGETLDRLCVSALTEAAPASGFSYSPPPPAGAELAEFYKGPFLPEFGHYKVFFKLAYNMAPALEVTARWEQMLNHEAQILSRQPPGSRIHSGF